MSGSAKTRPRVSSAPNKGGRPPKLLPDAATLKQVEGLGAIQATTKECAAFLDVSERTFISFLARHPEARDALESGKGKGRVSLRRTQFRLAETNAAMAIFLGKNLLGQADKQELEHSGESLTPPPSVIKIIGVAARHDDSPDQSA
jgi:hypothetical protein